MVLEHNDRRGIELKYNSDAEFRSWMMREWRRVQNERSGLNAARRRSPERVGGDRGLILSANEVNNSRKKSPSPKATTTTAPLQRKKIQTTLDEECKLILAKYDEVDHNKNSNNKRRITTNTGVISKPSSSYRKKEVLTEEMAAKIKQMIETEV